MPLKTSPPHPSAARQRLAAEQLIRPAARPSHRMNVGKKIIDRLVIRQNFGHQHHLCAGKVLWMDTANTLLEIMQLSRQIPVTHVRQPGGLRRPDTLAGSTVTGRA